MRYPARSFPRFTVRTWARDKNTSGIANTKRVSSLQCLATCTRKLTFFPWWDLEVVVTGNNEVMLGRFRMLKEVGTKGGAEEIS